MSLLCLKGAIKGLTGTGTAGFTTPVMDLPELCTCFCGLSSYFFHPTMMTTCPRNILSMTLCPFLWQQFNWVQCNSGEKKTSAFFLITFIRVREKKRPRGPWWEMTQLPAPQKWWNNREHFSQLNQVGVSPWGILVSALHTQADSSRVCLYGFFPVMMEQPLYRMFIHHTAWRAAAVLWSKI